MQFKWIWFPIIVSFKLLTKSNVINRMFVFLCQLCFPLLLYGFLGPLRSTKGSVLWKGMPEISHCSSPWCKSIKELSIFLPVNLRNRFFSSTGNKVLHSETIQETKSDIGCRKWSFSPSTMNKKTIVCSTRHFSPKQCLEIYKINRCNTG